MIVSDTPSNINALPVDSVLHFVEPKADNVPSARVRLNYVKMLYDVLGYTLTPDVALASVSEPWAELVLSTAGGGKTTWSQIKAIEQKAIRKSKRGNGKKITGDKILCLVYNNHNVADMQNKHAQLVNKLMSAGIQGLDIDTKINACTMHSFCEFCRKLFVAKLNLVGCTLMTEDEAVNLMSRAVKLEYKIQHLPDADKIAYDKVHALYTLCLETLKDVDQQEETDLFTDLQLPIELLQQIFTRFELMKAKNRKYEFIDMLNKVYQLLLTDDAALAQVQRYYEYVIADEVQDFTPLMWEILRLFVSDGTPLTCIGDEDQNLYYFRGADIKDTLQFKKRFPSGRVYTLSENRRCRKTILDEAKCVIKENESRFDKEIIGKKDGGSICLVPYNTMESQIIHLVKHIKKLSLDEQSKTVICYRNLDCSMLAAEVLAEADITINCLKSYKPYSHELYGHLLGILNALDMGCDREVFKCLWKVLPCKKNEFFAAIGYNSELRRFTTPDNKKHFTQYNYGKLMGYNGFSDVINILGKLSEDITTVPLSKIYPTVIRLLNLYFWNYKRSVNETEELDDIFERRVEKKFNVNKTFAEVLREIQNVKSICENNSGIHAGVTLSTFHSLKGLEFNSVYAIFMDNDIFPNFPLIEYKGYSKQVEQALKEAENRLWYVAVTRAIDSLTIYYNELNPSKYVLDYLERTEQKDVCEAVKHNIPLTAVDNAEDEFIIDDAVASANTPVEIEIKQNKAITGHSGYLSALFNRL